MNKNMLYTVISQKEEGAIAALVDRFGTKPIFGKHVYLKKMAYSDEEYRRLTSIVSNYFYHSFGVHEMWVGYEPEYFRNCMGSDTVQDEPVLESDVVVCDGEVYGLIKKNPYEELKFETPFQIVTKAYFGMYDQSYFYFDDPTRGDTDNSYGLECQILKKVENV